MPYAVERSFEAEHNVIEPSFSINLLEIQGKILHGNVSPSPPIIRMRPT